MSVKTERTHSTTGTEDRTLDPADIPIDLLRQVLAAAFEAVLEARAGADAGGDSKADRALAELVALCDEVMRLFGRPAKAPPDLPIDPPAGPMVLH